MKVARDYGQEIFPVTELVRDIEGWADEDLVDLTDAQYEKLRRLQDEVNAFALDLKPILYGERLVILSSYPEG